MNAMQVVLKEHLQHLYLIRRLSAYELKMTYAANLLGILWVFLNPLMQIGVFWLVFGLGIRGGAPVNGAPYFIWMISGLIPWFYISASIGKGANSIYTRLATVSRMNFPLSIIPTYVITAQLYTHLILLGVLIPIIAFIRGWQAINPFALVYAIIISTVFLVALSFITSTLSTIVRDVYLLIQSAVRMLFFFTPILWVLNSDAPHLLALAVKLNPVYYIVEVYRRALVYGNISFVFSKQTLYFWAVIALFFVIGTSIHVKFRKQFVDYL